jgi:ribosome-binding factor A
MRQHILAKERLRSLCAEIGDDDGQDPHLSAPRKSRARRARSRLTGPRAEHRDRKACQLCRQVAQTLDEVLAECGDAVLQGLRVASVEPFPDASRLLVSVASVVDRPGKTVEVGSVLDHLQRASGHLRCEVATAVTRKRTPVLVYRLAEPMAVGVGP